MDAVDRELRDQFPTVIQLGGSNREFARRADGYGAWVEAIWTIDSKSELFFGVVGKCPDVLY